MDVRAVCLLRNNYRLLLLLFAVLSGCGKGTEESKALSSGHTNGSATDTDLNPTRPAEIEDPLLEMTQRRSRFRLVYDVTVTQVPVNAVARVWIPLAQSTPHQWVQVNSIEVPTVYEQNAEAKHGNRLLYFETSPNDEGEIPVSIEYEVTRFEVEPSNYEGHRAEEGNLYLLPNRLVPVDVSLRDRLLPDFVEGAKTSTLARQIYDRVIEHVDYRKPIGESWGRGDARWVCDSQFGNCTDFHSLYISLCRTCEIPARFEMGFEVPEESSQIAGYHCWAFFSENSRWVPVDVSEADRNTDRVDSYFGRLPSRRVTMTSGRDLLLSPLQTGEPVNYLIDPYVEVSGEVHSELERAYRVEVLEDVTKSSQR